MDKHYYMAETQVLYSLEDSKGHRIEINGSYLVTAYRMQDFLHHNPDCVPYDEMTGYRVIEHKVKAVLPW